MTRNGILGGGALGLTSALRLAQRGEDVVVIEREQIPGGLAAGFRLGPSYLEKFYHHLFLSDHDAVALIDELNLSDRLLWPRPKTSTYIDGRMQQLDSALSVLRFSPLSIPDRFRLGAGVAYLKAERNFHRLEHTTASAWVQRWMGRHTYDKIWGPLLDSKFGEYADQVVMSWLWARLHYRSTSLGYVRGGFQQVYDALVARIRDLGGTVLLDTEITGVARQPDGTYLVDTKSGPFTFDRIISTLPTRLLIRLMPDLDGDYARKYGDLVSFGAHVAVLSLTRRLSDVYWLSISDPGFPFLVVVEHTNYMPVEDYGGRHVLYLGNYLPMNHRYFTATDEVVLGEFLPALARIYPDFDPSWVSEHRIFKAPFAQPIMTLGYPDRIPPHEGPFPNLYVANMSQVYPQDRGQNYSIRMANELVRKLPVLSA